MQICINLYFTSIAKNELRWWTNLNKLISENQAENTETYPRTTAAANIANATQSTG